MGKFLQKIRGGLQKFMQGRYGNDKLNIFGGTSHR